jgi:hypothetical protein
MIDAAFTEDLYYLLNEWTEDDEDTAAAAASARLIAVGLMTSRKASMLLESSKSPIPSPEGGVLRLVQ